jgi:hypothetical protein
MSVSTGRARRGLIVLAAGITVTFAAATPSAAATPNAGPPPSSMASLGDSITRGFNACGWYVDCPSRSFSTGSTTSVNSHYLRIRAKNAAIDGKNFNDGRSGAKAADMPGQAASAVSQGVGYVTMLIGANDACTSSDSTMTSVAAFRGSIDSALARIKAGLPNARVLVISVPDVKRLWQVGRTNAGALTAWSVFGICQSMLANPLSTASADAQRRGSSAPGCNGRSGDCPAGGVSAPSTEMGGRPPRIRIWRPMRPLTVEDRRDFPGDAYWVTGVF